MSAPKGYTTSVMNVTKYKQYRAQGVPAHLAAAWARTPDLAEQYPGVTWEGGWYATDYKLPNGHIVQIDLELDDAEIDGKFTDRWESGAVQNPAYRGPGRADVYQWYLPLNDVDESRRALRRLGYARHEAWRLAMGQARCDAKRDGGGEARRYGIRVRVLKRDEHGVETTVGDADLWGIDASEGEAGREYLRGTARDLIAEVIG